MRTLLIGTESFTTELIGDIQTNQPKIALIGVIEANLTNTADKPRTTSTLAGIPICGSIPDVPHLIVQEKIDIVIIALLNVERSVYEILIDQTPPGKVIWKIIPHIQNPQNIPLTYTQLLPLSASDLIGRREMFIDIPYLQEVFHDKTVLVTGAGGSIGSELVKNLLYYPVKRILALTRSEHSLCTLSEYIEEEHPEASTREKLHTFIANVKDSPRLHEIAEEFPVDIILHTAAHKHVPLMENNEKEAIKNNVLATHNLLKFAHKKNIRSFVFISTDKAVIPKSIMGASKKLAEQLVRKFNEATFPFESSIVRLGNVIGSRGSVIPLFNKQIKSGGPITVTHRETKRYFMTITEASLLIMTISALTLKRANLSRSHQNTPDTPRSKTYILKMGESILIDSLVRRIVRLYGLVPDKDIPISYIGMRPGEKLDEILYNENSELIKTKNPNILEILEHPEDLTLIEKRIYELEKTIDTCSPADVRKLLKDLNLLIA